MRIDSSFQEFSNSSIQIEDVLYQSPRSKPAGIRGRPKQGAGDAIEYLGHFAFPIEQPRKNHPLEITLGYDDRAWRCRRTRARHGREIKREFAESDVNQNAAYQMQVQLLNSVPLRD